MKNYTAPHGESEKTVLSNLEEMLPLIEECLSAGQSVKFSPRGISMLPMLVQGRDSVTISPAPKKLKKFDIPLYRRANGSFVLHRVVKVEQTYTCVGDNQIAYEHGVTHESVIGVVSSFNRNGKDISVTNPWYMMYCRFWCGTRIFRRIWRGLKRRVKKIIKRN